MGHCKCRQCGVVVAVKAWAATKNGACPQCAHPLFSISFPSAAPLGQAATLQAGPTDAHGRTRKVIRLENLASGTGKATPKLPFKDRMRAYASAGRRPEQHDDEA